MVIKTNREAGMLMVEIMVAIAIFILAMLPLGFGFLNERKVTRSDYQRAVVMEAIDGEMEILLAGEWKTAQEGTQPYPLPAAFAKIMPRGNAALTITGKHVRLHWLPDEKYNGGEVVREADVP